MGRLKELLPSDLLKNIANLLLKPLYFAKPVGTPLDTWLEHCFGVRERPITFYLVKRDFVLHGAFYEVPAFPSDRRHVRVRKGEFILMRFDKTRPFEYDIEVSSGRGGASEVYGITVDEWQELLPSVFPLNNIRLMKSKESYAIVRNTRTLINAGCPRDLAQNLAKRYSETYASNFS